MNANPWQVGGWRVAGVGGLTAAALGILQAIQNRQLREKELRWKQAESGKHLIDEIFDEDLSNSATLILDSWDRTYKVPGGDKVKLAWNDVVRALDMKFFDEDNPQNDFVRDCFDMLFYYLDRLEHLIQAGLTTFEDVRLPIEYYVDMLAEREDRTVIEAYIRACKYQKIWKFLDRFPAWAKPPIDK